MKLIFLVVIALTALGCDPTQPEPAVAAPANSSEATFLIEGMTCASCGLTVELAAKKVAGVSTAKVNYDDKTLQVVFDAKSTTEASIGKAVTASGYKTTLRPGG